MTGQIEDGAHKYIKTLALPSTDLNKLIKSRFKDAIADSETRNQHLWDDTGMTLNQMVQKAQQFEDFWGCEGAKPKKSLRMTDDRNKPAQEHHDKRKSFKMGSKYSIVDNSIQRNTAKIYGFQP